MAFGESGWVGPPGRGEFHIGVGGYCDDLTTIDGPTGYWCAMRPPRGQVGARRRTALGASPSRPFMGARVGWQCWDKATNTGSGCTQTHMSPDGMVLARAANYSKPHEAVVQSWRGGGRHVRTVRRKRSRETGALVRTVRREP